MWWHGVHLDLPQGLLTSWQFRGSGYLWITFSTQPRSWAGGWGQHSLLVAGFAAFQDRAQWPWSGGSKHLPSVWSPDSSAFTHFFHPLLLFAELGAGPSWAERIHLQSPSPPAACGDLRFLCSGLFLPLFHFRKTDFSSSKRNIWLMASLKCLRFCDNCLFLKNIFIATFRM